MRHLKAGRKLGVSNDHRTALIRSLTLALIERETIKTTHTRAKELRWYADRVVTLAKRGDVASRRRIVQMLGSTQSKPNTPNRVRTAIDRVYAQLVPRFKTRPGGYTQILRLATRRAGDNADMVVMQYLPAPDEKKDKGRREKKDSKKKVEASAEDKLAKSEKKTSAEDKDETKPRAKKKDKEKSE
jgi:large subunit ribosomal protein L17